MDPVLIGGAVSALAGSGLFSGKNNNNAWNERQTHLAREYEIWQRNVDYARQKEFAKMGLTWKVRDARNAGLHPLAALGAGGAAFSPSGGISVGAAPDSQQYGPSPVASAMESMGQNLLRAQTATQTDAQRELEALTLQNMRLRNRELEASITSKWASVMGQPGNPPMHSAAGPSVPPGAVRVVPDEVPSAKKGHPSLTAGNQPFSTRFNLGGGASVDLPSRAAAESMESMGPFAAPFINGISALRRWWHGPDDPPNLRLPPGYRWEWSVNAQAFRPVAPPAVQRREAIDKFRNYRSGRGNAPIR